MPVSANPWGNLLAQRPQSPESFTADRQAVEAGGITNALNAAKLGEYQQGLQRSEQLRNLLSSGAGSDQLVKGGFLKEGMDLAKNKADVANTNAQESTHRVDAFAKKAGIMKSSIGSVPSPQAAARYMQQAFADPDMGPVMKQFGTLEEALSEIPQDPAGFQKWQMQASEGIGKLADHAMKQQQLDATIRGQDLSAATQRRWQDIQQGNNIRSNERMIGNGGGGGVAMSKPFELTGEDGQQVVVQQDKQGNIRPVQGFSPKPAAPNAAQQKELMSINQQRSIVNGALNAVTSTPGAFTFKRGVAGKLPFGETLAGRTETPQETQARAYVFNNVSRVINERAGAAQSAQELARLNSFLPADTDGPEQIKNKLNGFITYLNDLESGTRGKPTQAGGATQPSNQGPKAGDVDGGYRFKGGDPSNPSNWEKVK